MQLEFEPNLSTCIHSLAKQEYDRTMRELLKAGKQEKQMMQRLEMLREFLETTDFARLRAEYEPLLLEGKKIRFILRTEGTKVQFDMEVM